MLFKPDKIIDLFAPYCQHDSAIHGRAHWARVYRYGMLLADHQDLPMHARQSVALFAWFHDLYRFHDSHDREHGPLAASHLQDAVNEVLPELDAEIVATTKVAIQYHSDGFNVQEAWTEGLLQDAPWDKELSLMTIGSCWDADRLDLLRLGGHMRADKMSTPYWQEVLPLAEKLNKSSPFKGSCGCCCSEK